MNLVNWSQHQPTLLKLSETIWNHGRRQSAVEELNQSQFTSLAHLKCRCKNAIPSASLKTESQTESARDFSDLETCFKQLKMATKAPHFGESGWQQLISRIGTNPGVTAAFVVDAHGLVITSFGDLEHDFIEEKGSRLILAFEQIESHVNESSQTLAFNIQAQGSNANCWPIRAADQNYFLIVLSDSLLDKQLHSALTLQCQKLSTNLVEEII